MVAGLLVLLWVWLDWVGLGMVLFCFVDYFAAEVLLWYFRCYSGLGLLPGLGGLFVGFGFACCLVVACFLLFD